MSRNRKWCHTFAVDLQHSPRCVGCSMNRVADQHDSNMITVLFSTSKYNLSCLIMITACICSMLAAYTAIQFGINTTSHHSIIAAYSCSMLAAYIIMQYGIDTISHHNRIAAYTCRMFAAYTSMQYSQQDCSMYPVSILYKSIAGRYRPVRVVTGRYRPAIDL